MNAKIYAIQNYLSQPTSVTIKNEIYASKYVSLKYRTPSPDEISSRRMAQNLKVPTDEAIQIAGPAMAALIDGPCWLVPVPASDGSVTANLALAKAIAKMVPGGRVKCAVGRAHAVDSSHNRRLHGLPRLTIDEHAIIRTGGPMQILPVFFVDNVITTGTTIAACRRALGWGIGLAYAGASQPCNAPGSPYQRDPLPHQGGWMRHQQHFLSSPINQQTRKNHEKSNPG